MEKKKKTFDGDLRQSHRWIEVYIAWMKGRMKLTKPRKTGQITLWFNWCKILLSLNYLDNHFSVFHLICQCMQGPRMGTFSVSMIQFGCLPWSNSLCNYSTVQLFLAWTYCLCTPLGHNYHTGNLLCKFWSHWERIKGKTYLLDYNDLLRDLLEQTYIFLKLTLILQINVNFSFSDSLGSVFQNGDHLFLTDRTYLFLFGWVRQADEGQILDRRVPPYHRGNFSERMEGKF